MVVKEGMEGLVIKEENQELLLNEENKELVLKEGECGKDIERKMRSFCSKRRKRSCN
jgi:hypothetical protein